METIILSIIIALVAIACFIISIFQFMEKGFLFNNAYIYASKKQREEMDKKPYYRQSAIVFFLIGITFSINTIEVITDTGWLTYAVLAIIFITIVYAIVSTIRKI